jgi:hypothetical protein
MPEKICTRCSEKDTLAMEMVRDALKKMKQWCVVSVVEFFIILSLLIGLVLK